MSRVLSVGWVGGLNPRLKEGGVVEHGHEGHSAAGAVVRGGGGELGSGRGRRRSGGRSGWGGGSVDRGILRQS